MGPIGLLCINKTMHKGRLSGFVSGMGAASADMFYGGIAAFGLTIISGFLIDKAPVVKLLGGLFMCYLGLKIFFSKQSGEKLENESKNLLGDYSSTFFLTITNPMTILSFTAIFAGLGIINSKVNIFNSSLLVLGVFVGSAFWWLLLCLGVEFMNKKSNKKLISLISKFSGLTIFIFGLWALFS